MGATRAGRSGKLIIPLVQCDACKCLTILPFDLSGRGSIGMYGCALVCCGCRKDMPLPFITASNGHVDIFGGSQSVSVFLLKLGRMAEEFLSENPRAKIEGLEAGDANLIRIIFEWLKSHDKEVKKAAWAVALAIAWYVKFRLESDAEIKQAMLEHQQAVEFENLQHRNAMELNASQKMSDEEARELIEAFERLQRLIQSMQTSEVATRYPTVPDSQVHEIPELGDNLSPEAAYREFRSLVDAHNRIIMARWQNLAEGISTRPTRVRSITSRSGRTSQK